MGFYGPKGYLKDRWNWLDFLVVLTGWISFIPSIPNVSIIRTFRVLRPLKSISTNPGLQSLVLAILNSIPELMGVLVLLLFVFLLFGITGVQLFSGPGMHARCRLTPHPVDLSWVPGASHEEHRCLPASNFNTLGDEPWTKDTSAWSTPQDCFWPIATSSPVRFCSFGKEGMNRCIHQKPLNESDWTWCGANYDATGNPRFKSKEIMEEATFVSDLNWGYTNFDNIGTAFITIFQCITLEGWTDIMYQTQDSVSEPLAAVVFVCLILFGTFFCLNLVLAVLEDNFVHVRVDRKSSVTLKKLVETFLEKHLPDLPFSDSFQQFRHDLRHVIHSPWFSHGVTALIVGNTIVLSLTHYPEDAQFENYLDAFNFLFSLLFGLEMSLKIIAFGLTRYLLVPENVFDAVIVIISFTEVVTAPPVFFGGHPSSSGAISALRSFRLFRILKLFSKWKSMKALLSKVLKTVLDLGNFALLLFLFLYIYTLIGMQFFANRFRFDANGHPYSSIGSSEWRAAEDWSRSNFDDFPHSFATVFQILTTENWNMILYDCRRSIGPASMIYPCTLIIFGVYIFMNLFLAILIGNFSQHDTGTGTGSGTPGENSGNGSASASASAAAASGEETVSKYRPIRGKEKDKEENKSKRIEMMRSVGSTSKIPLQLKPSESGKGNGLRQGKRRSSKTNSAKIQPGPAPASVSVSPELKKLEGPESELEQERERESPVAREGKGWRDSGRNVLGGEVSEDEKEGSPGLAKRQLTPEMFAQEMLTLETPLTQQEIQEQREQQQERQLEQLQQKEREGEEKEQQQQQQQQLEEEEEEASEGSFEEDDDEDLEENSRYSRAGGGGAGGENGGRSMSLNRSSSEFTSLSKAMKATSLGVFSASHPLRQFCFTLIRHPLFDRIILCLIVISSVTLAIDNPLLNPNSTLAQFLRVLDIFLTVIFTLEMVIKIIALGLIMHPGAYLRSPWNGLDLFVVAISLAGVFSGSKSLVSLRSLRAIRGLRPLRVINRAPGLKLVVNAVLASLPDVVNVAGLCFLFFLIFAIFGVNYFKGQLRHCTGEIFRESVEPYPEYMSLLTHPKPWDSLSDLEKSYFGPNSTILPSGSCLRTHHRSQLEELAQGQGQGLGLGEGQGQGLGLGEAQGQGQGQELWLAQGEGEGQGEIFEYDYPNEPCCNSYPTSASLITSRMICECWGGRWDFIDINNFDNVGAALLTLFQMSTTEGWVTLMYDLVDTSDIHMQPIRDNHVEWIFFCIFFMLIASYLALNLFVGVVIDNFNKMKKKLDDHTVILTASFLTPEQQEWIKTQEIVRRIKPNQKPLRPIELLPRVAFDVCYHPWFDWFILYCILVNTLTMAMNYYGQEHLYGLFLEKMNLIFAAIFSVEAALKIFALRSKYFTDSWNQYDFFIVLGTNAGLLYRWIAGSNVGLTITIFRTFRIARIFRLMNGTSSINQLLNTLILTLPGLGNIAALLFLLFFIFAVTGIQLFAKVGYHGAHNEHANFRDFGIALLTLLRFATGEAWNNFMFDVSRKPTDCIPNPEYDPKYCGFNDHIGCLPLNGCGTLSIFPYLISFTIVMSVVFINLFVGVILEGFCFSNDEREGGGGSVKPEDFMKFADHWAHYDPTATCYLSVSQLEEFVQTLGEPLGFGCQMKRKELNAKIAKLPLHILPGRVVHFKDVLSALSTDAICRASERKGASGVHLADFVDQMFKSETGTGRKKEKLSGFLLELAQRKQQQQYTMEHFYAVKQIEGPCLKLIQRIRKKRAAAAELVTVPDHRSYRHPELNLDQSQSPQDSPLAPVAVPATDDSFLPPLRDPTRDSRSSPVDPFILSEDRQDGSFGQ